MVKLKEVLNQQKVEELQKAAKDMGFRNIRLFKSALVDEIGPLGVYVEFESNVTDRYGSRCLALTYKISNIIGCQAMVVSDKDAQGDFAKRNSIDLNYVSTGLDLENVPETHVNELEIKSNNESSYKRSMLSYKVIYEQLYNSKSLPQMKDKAEELELIEQTKLGKRTFDKLSPELEIFIMNTTVEEFGAIKQAILDKVTKKTAPTQKK